jgi:activator of HSP90 ATPase
MSIHKLTEVIRKIVREEVRKEVRQILNEQSKPKTTTSEFKSGVAHALGLQDSVERRAKAPQPQQQFTKNKMLNDILNETAGELRKRASDDVDYKMMSDRVFSSNHAQGFNKSSLTHPARYGYTATNKTPSLQEMLPTTDIRGQKNYVTEVDPSVAKALTRDYSELVKRFKK